MVKTDAARPDDSVGRGCWIPDSGYLMLDSGYLMPDD